MYVSVIMVMCECTCNENLILFGPIAYFEWLQLQTYCKTIILCVRLCSKPQQMYTNSNYGSTRSRRALQLSAKFLPKTPPKLSVLKIPRR